MKKNKNCAWCGRLLQKEETIYTYNTSFTGKGEKCNFCKECKEEREEDEKNSMGYYDI